MKQRVQSLALSVYLAALRPLAALWRLNRHSYMVIPVIGQSNAVGYGRGVALSTRIPHHRVAQLAPDRQVLPAVEPLAHPVIRWQGVGALTTYAHRLTRTSQRRVLLVPVAVGDVGFTPTADYSWDPTNTTARVNLFHLAKEQICAALALNPESRIREIVCALGEHDVSQGMSADEYGRLLRSLIDGFAAEFGPVPFTLIGMNPDWLDSRDGHGHVIDAEQRRLADEGVLRFVPGPENMHNDGEWHHYTAAGQAVIADRLYETSLIASKMGQTVTA